MDPKGIAKFGPFEDNQPTSSQFRRQVVFNDGTRGWEIYEYGTDGVQATVPDEKLGTDTKQAADYAEYVRKTTPVRTDTTIENGTQVTRETPEGGQTRITETKPATGQAAAAKGTKTTLENGEMVTREIEADGSQGRITAQRPATKAEIDAVNGPQPVSGTKREPVPKHPGITKVTKAAKQGTNETEEIYYENEAGERVPTPVDAKEPEKPTYREVDGKLYEVKPDGTLVPARIEGAKSTMTPFPKGSSLGELGRVLVEYQQELTEKVNRGEMTKAEALKEMEAYQGIATTIYQETSKIADIQQGAYNADVTQRGQTLQDVQSRRNFSTNAMTQAYDFNKSTAPYLPADARGGAGNAFLGSLLLNHAMAGASGGMRQVPEVQKPAAYQQILGMPGMAPAAAPPAPNVTIINASPQTASPAPTVQADVPRVPGGGFLPPGGPLSFTGGQLRAPGYREPDPADYLGI